MYEVKINGNTVQEHVDLMAAAEQDKTRLCGESYPMGVTHNASEKTEGFEERHKAYTDAKHRFERLAQALAAHPASFDLGHGQLRPWMIDISGNTGYEGREAFAAELVAQGFKYSDSGIICGKDIEPAKAGWDLGYLCTEESAKVLCRLIYMKYGLSIAAGELTVTRKFWGWNYTPKESEKKELVPS